MILSFNVEIFWNAFSAIATTFTAIVAIVISIISILLSNKPKLKVQWKWHPLLGSEESNKTDKAKTNNEKENKIKIDIDINITIINTGKVSVDVYEYGLFLHNRKKKFFDYYFASIDKNHPSLPLKLNVGDSYSFLIPYKYYLKEIRDLKKDGFFTKFYVRTSNGKYFSKKVKSFKYKKKEKYSIVIVNNKK